MARTTVNPLSLGRIAVFVIVMSLSLSDCGAACPQRPPTVDLLLSADTEGHVSPCRECPYHPGLGGLARRAGVLSKLRKENEALLLVDAGNFLIGAESLQSRGSVIIAAYNTLEYDAVNLCHRDLWLGKTATLTLVKQARFAILSANLLDAETGELLAQAYAVKHSGGKRIGLIGVAQAPAGMDFLPHLKEQLAGIRIEPPVEALAKWLPKAKTEADQVILLYYGTAAGLIPIRERFGSSFAAILVGGIRPETLPSDAKPPIIATSNHGRHLGKVSFTASSAEVSQIAIEPSIQPDLKLERLLAKYTALK